MDATVILVGREICMLWAKGSTNNTKCLVIDAIAAAPTAAIREYL